MAWLFWTFSSLFLSWISLYYWTLSLIPFFIYWTNSFHFIISLFWVQRKQELRVLIRCQGTFFLGGGQVYWVWVIKLMLHITLLWGVLVGCEWVQGARMMNQRQQKTQPTFGIWGGCKGCQGHSTLSSQCVWGHLANPTSLTSHCW